MRSKLLRAHLNELLVFEVVARSGSFSKAARELGMTQSAVSHHIANLETALGAQLFLRVWRGVALTEAGRELHAVSGRALPALADGLAGVSARRDPRQITIHTDFAVATYYLMPQLTRLREAADGADIRILTSPALATLDLGRLDLGIVFGAAGAFGANAVPLVHEIVAPVASPAVAATLGHLSAATLPGGRLLQLESHSGDWLDWRGYAELARLPRPKPGGDLTFDNYHLLTEAALAGDGVALGWRPLIDRFLETGRLVAVGPTVTRRRWGYFLVRPGAPAQDAGFARLLAAIRADFA